MRMLSKRSAALVVAVTGVLFATAESARAAPVWVGDFETNDLSQWSYKLNEQNISVVTSPVLQGTRAGQIKLTNDSTWPNGLKRVELNHAPGAARTAEGKELYFAWSFYLPETLPVDPGQTIGYWESDQSYQQMMALHVEGEKLRFITQKPQYKVHYETDGKIKPAVWHRIAMHVKWSKDSTKGAVDVWLDGEQIVNNVAAQTLADDNAHFTQVGLLRGKVEFQDAPIIYLDDAVEGDSLDDVHPELPADPGTGGAGGGGSSSSSASGGGSSSASSSSSGSSSASGGGSSSGDTSTDGGDCGCRQIGSTRTSGAAGFAAIMTALSFAGYRRRRAARRRSDA